MTTTISIHDLMRQVREHPDYIAGSVFVRDDFPDPERAAENGKWIEEAMTRAGFEAENELR